MNTRSKISVAALASTAVVVTGIGIVTAGSASAATDTLSDKQLVALYEEERLAGDVYDELGKQTSESLFDRIAVSEDHHQAAVAGLLENRGYDISGLPTRPGDYVTDGYDEMYDAFVTTGSASVEDAYGVGVAIEEADIADLDSLLGQTDDPAEITVLEALLAGSTHHLAAFSGDVTTGSRTGGPGQGRGPVSGAPGVQQSPGSNARGGLGAQGRSGGQGMQGQRGDCLADGSLPQGQGGMQRHGW